MINSELIKKYNFKFNKNFGQNFIFDNNLLSAIVSDADVEKYKNVLEIGTGAGTLTKQIAKKANKVVSYEIDKNLEPIIKENLSDVNNVTVVFKDILKEDIKTIESYFDGDYIIIANLPYYITTPIIFKFIEEATNLKQLVIMVQKEVAERIVAKEGTKDYGAITAQISAVANCQITRIVNRNMFMPAPNVDSAILKIVFCDKGVKILSKELLSKVIACAFNMRRKTLSNNLKKGFNLSQEAIDEMLNKIQVPLNVRGECLNYKQFIELSNLIYKTK